MNIGCISGYSEQCFLLFFCFWRQTLGCCFRTGRDLDFASSYLFVIHNHHSVLLNIGGHKSIIPYKVQMRFKIINKICLCLYFAG